MSSGTADADRTLLEHTLGAAAVPVERLRADDTLGLALEALAGGAPGNALFEIFDVELPPSGDGRDVFVRHGIDAAALERFLTSGTLSPAMAALYERAKRPPAEAWGEPQLVFAQAQSFVRLLYRAAERRIGVERQALLADKARLIKAGAGSAELAAVDARLENIGARLHDAYHMAILPVLRADDANQSAWTAQIEDEARENATLAKRGESANERQLASIVAAAQLVALAFASRQKRRPIDAATFETARAKVEMHFALAQGRPRHPRELLGLSRAQRDLRRVGDADRQRPELHRAAGELREAIAEASDLYLESLGLGATQPGAPSGALSPSEQVEAVALARLALDSRQASAGHHADEGRAHKGHGNLLGAAAADQRRVAVERHLEARRARYHGLLAQPPAAAPAESVSLAEPQELRRLICAAPYPENFAGPPEQVTGAASAVVAALLLAGQPASAAGALGAWARALRAPTDAATALCEALQKARLTVAQVLELATLVVGLAALEAGAKLGASGDLVTRGEAGEPLELTALGAALALGRLRGHGGLERLEYLRLRGRRPEAERLGAPARATLALQLAGELVPSFLDPRPDAMGCAQLEDGQLPEATRPGEPRHACDLALHARDGARAALRLVRTTLEARDEGDVESFSGEVGAGGVVTLAAKAAE